MFWLCSVAVLTFSSVSALVLDGGTSWPNGTYGLIKAASGCPGGGVTWLEGARKFDTEDSDAHNYFSANVSHFLAGVYSSNDITTEFCMKTTSESGDTAPVWPSGNYCILKLGPCPDGFQNGSLYWDDDDWNNHNSYSGTMPDGEYGTNTRIDFCCRKDGPPEDPVSLPTSSTFVLFRYGLVCQQVNGMVVTQAFVRWDDEDIFNTDAHSFAVPYDDGGQKDHKLHFCSYSSQSSIVVG